MSLKLTTSPEGYDLSVLTEPTCQLRTYFDSLPGKIRMRTVDLLRGYASLVIFQIKNDPAGTTSIFRQELSPSQETSQMVEQTLRNTAKDIPAGNDERPPTEFIHYYQTPFSGVGCSIKPNDLGIISLGIDYRAGVTLRMIQPNSLVGLLERLELNTSYTAEIKNQRSGVSGMELLCHEYKQECGHILFEKKG